MQVCARRYINNPSYFSARHALSVYICIVYSSDTPFFFSYLTYYLGLIIWCAWKVMQAHITSDLLVYIYTILFAKKGTQYTTL
ncbi:Os05g0418901 [Oryza sativa Japonica Group]|uniref:Os05g0418901 protein n=1 Tax=Oryza sativa subsp. japonica TaxID=39947 RepID=A0A0P0WMI5_ORYSJ|nr:Os05g0418901 [Oryza sativa Japonica Group]